MFVDLDRIDEVMQRIVDPDMDLEKAKEVFSMMGQPASRFVATMPENKPRFIKTHLPMSLLNPKLLDTSKVVYVARDPRDVVVSCYHQARLFKIMRCPGSFKEFWSIFYRDLCKYMSQISILLILTPILVGLFQSEFTVP